MLKSALIRGYKKMKNKYLLFGIFIGALIVGLYYFYSTDKRGYNADEHGYFKGLIATIYKTPNCGCCENYISYLKSNGFKVEKKEVSDEELTNLKKQIGIPENLWSCHTVLLTQTNADKIYPNNNRINYPNNRPNENEILGQHSGKAFGQYSGNNINPISSAYLYFIEGHIPIEAINKLLTEKPEINGIALPQMPSGSPGMPGFKLSPFKIHSVKNGQDQGIFMEI